MFCSAAFSLSYTYTVYLSHSRFALGTYATLLRALRCSRRTNILDIVHTLTKWPTEPRVVISRGDVTLNRLVARAHTLGYMYGYLYCTHAHRSASRLEPPTSPLYCRRCLLRAANIHHHYKYTPCACAKRNVHARAHRERRAAPSTVQSGRNRESSLR